MPTALLVRLAQVSFVLAVALGLRAAKRAGFDRRWAGALAVLVGAALAIRLALPAGPADVNPVGLRALVPVWLWTWERGIGAPAVQQVLLAPAVLAGTIDERALYALTAVLGAVSCGLVAVLARALGADRSTAILAGAVLAFDVAHARLSHTDSPIVLEVTLLLAALVVLRGSAPSTSSSLSGGLLLALAALVRAESPVGAVVALIVLGASGWVWRDRRTWAVALPVGVAVALQAWGALAFYGRGPNTDSLPGGVHTLWLDGWRAVRALDPTWTSPVVPIAAVLGVVLGRVPARTRGGLAVAAIVASVWDPSREHAVPGLLAFGMAHLQLRADPLVAILAGLGVTGLVARLPGPVRPWTALVGGTFLVLAAAWLPVAATPVVAEAEDAFVLAHRGDVPEDCTVVMVRPRTDGGLVPYRTTPQVRRGDPRWAWTGETPPSGCTVWYRAATCALAAYGGAEVDAAAMRAECADFESRHALTPIAVASLTGGPWMFDRYVEDPVRVGFYRVR